MGNVIPTKTDRCAACELALRTLGVTIEHAPGCHPAVAIYDGFPMPAIALGTIVWFRPRWELN